MERKDHSFKNIFDDILDKNDESFFDESKIEKDSREKLANYIVNIMVNIQDTMDPGVFKECRYKVLENKMPSPSQLDRAFQETMYIGAYKILSILKDEIQEKGYQIEE